MLTESEWRDGKRIVRCSCGWKRLTHWPLAQIHHMCRLGPCAHLGGEVCREQCPSCKGTTWVKVFDCAVLRECTPIPSKLDLPACTSCQLYQELPPSDTASCAAAIDHPKIVS